MSETQTAPDERKADMLRELGISAYQALDGMVTDVAKKAGIDPDKLPDGFSVTFGKKAENSRSGHDTIAVTPSRSFGIRAEWTHTNLVAGAQSTVDVSIQESGTFSGFGDFDNPDNPMNEEEYLRLLSTKLREFEGPETTVSVSYIVPN